MYVCIHYATYSIPYIYIHYTVNSIHLTLDKLFPCLEEYAVVKQWGLHNQYIKYVNILYTSSSNLDISVLKMYTIYL